MARSDGKPFIVTKAVTVDIGGAYSTGESLHTDVLQIAGVFRNQEAGFKLEAIAVSDKAAQSSQLDLVIFSGDPSATTFTANNALDVDDADLVRILNVINIPAANYAAFADSTVASVRLTVPLTLKPANGTDSILYVALVCRGTPTYVATTDVQLTLIGQQV